MPGNPTYAEILTKPFHDGLDNPWNFQVPVDGVESLSRCTQSVLELAGVIPWNSLGLPDGNTGNGLIPPSEYGIHLAKAALEDAQSLMSTCEVMVAAYEKLPPSFNMRSALLASTATILGPLVNNLPDHCKSQLNTSLIIPDASVSLMGISFREMPVQIATAEHGTSKYRFIWSRQVSDWLDKNKDPARGCPAHKILVSGDEGQQIPLTYYLWNKLVKAKYGLG